MSLKFKKYRNKTLTVGLIGPGAVGTELLTQITRNKAWFKQNNLVDIHVSGIMNSRVMLLNPDQNQLPHWEKQLPGISGTNITQFINYITSNPNAHHVIIDCTASEEISTQYCYFIRQGCHLITSNKLANSSHLETFKALQACVKQSNQYYFYETTVCSGLPVIQCIQNLTAVGDQIQSIEGIVSGTMAFILNQCAKGKSFAHSVREAYRLNYTEPDPRLDLNGIDIGRKFVCLARELGLDSSIEDLELINFVPEELKDVSIQIFLEKIGSYQGPIQKKIDQALQENHALAYVGKIKDNKISLFLKGYPVGHPFSTMTDTDNILLITSNYYNKRPLIIQGPGAGIEVTAAGILGDLLHLASVL